MSKMTLSQELQWRGFVNQTTLTDLSKLDENKLKFYHGYDASSDSLTVGNLAALMLDKCFMRHGHEAVLLAGGATSLIGDPGGKEAERTLQSADVIAANVGAVRMQIEQLIGAKVTMVNNIDWYKEMNVLEYLRDVGKYFSMTPLVQRDYIAKRMGEGGAGISYTEFSYTILQGYDFLYLYRKYGATLQLAGSDQWGNSLSGVDLIRRVEGKETHVFTCPLIIDKATGKKFGKSEDGAVWLDSAKTSVYKFYQFWLNSDDEGVEGYLKVFTELNKSAIDTVMDEFNKNKADRAAQKTLAYEVTKLVHGKESAETQKELVEVLFETEDYLGLSDKHFGILRKELPVATISKAATLDDFVAVLVDLGLASSKTQARQFIEAGAIYVNGEKMQTSETRFLFDTISKSAVVVVRRGKNSNAIVQIGN
jgi:tyrosyl-tRNA synthetase